MNDTISSSRSGFTLIELLVVVSIIGLLASTVLASLQEARTSAQYSVVIQELQVIENAIIVAGSTGTESLRSITGNNCSDCSCRWSGVDLRNIDTAGTPEATACLTRLNPALQRIANVSPAIDSPEAIRLDPWNSPYMIDENEGEVATNPCRRDTVRSVGPDGFFGTADDYVVLLPFRTSACR